MARVSGLRQRQKKKRRLVVALLALAGAVFYAGWYLVDSGRLQKVLQQGLSVPATMRSAGDEVRGILYDRNYRALAISMERVSVYVRTRELESVDSVAAQLAPVLGVPVAELARTMRGDELRIWLARDIRQQQEEQIRSLDLPGIYFHTEYRRYYPHKDKAAHLVGFVQDDIGLAGVEHFYDKLVQQMLAENGGPGFQGGTGQHLILTIDLKVQEILENLIKDLALGRENQSIGAYVMDAGSGAVVAAAQYPSFNPNDYRIYSQLILDDILTRSMPLPSLYRGILRDAASIQIQFESRGQAHPWSISARQQSLGGELRLWESLGFDDNVPPDFGRTDDGRLSAPGMFLLPDQHERDFGTVPEALSPLTVMSAFSTLLNGGNKVEPYLVQAVKDPLSGSDFDIRAEHLAKGTFEGVAPPVSREVARLISLQGKGDELGGVTLYDSVRREFSSKLGYGSMNNDVYLTAIPVQNAELVVLVTLQLKGQGVREKINGKMTDPLRAIEKVMPRIAVMQQVGKTISDVAEPEDEGGENYPVELRQLRAAIRASLEENIVEPVDPGMMPDVTGLSLRKSLRLLQGKPCELRIFGTGRVIGQEPAAGSPLSGVEQCVLRLQEQGDVQLETLEEKLAE